MAIHPRPAAVLLITLTAAGCAGGAVSPPGAGWVPAGEERLAVADSASVQRAVRFDDGDEIEEYGRVSLDPWRAEYLYAAADGTDVALTGTFDVGRALALFRRHADTAAPGDLGRIERKAATIFYRPFVEAGAACFGFEADWSNQPPGAGVASGQILLGYACRDGAQPSTKAEVEAFLVRLAPQPPLAPDHLPDLPTATTATDYALGRDQSGKGLVGFPLRIARRYVGADGELF